MARLTKKQIAAREGAERESSPTRELRADAQVTDIERSAGHAVVNRSTSRRLVTWRLLTCREDRAVATFISAGGITQMSDINLSVRPAELEPK